MKVVLIALLSIYFIGCVSLNTVSLTSIPANRSKPVVATTERLMFFGFNFDNDYVDYLTDNLKNQCPHGLISGVLTKDESIDYFLYIVWKKRITAQGYCVSLKSAASSKSSSNIGSENPRKRNPSNMTSEIDSKQESVEVSDE
ncbi:MAG: hypothetical protein L6Q37_03415 [Bdellovibrionaceae bacterium]|nr:hypothetical protein [Pseudobdellovibrionaceae bacterium]NUM59744.1 hypothetical protein [Pseudobdellovibrionaceae bacterium]